MRTKGAPIIASLAVLAWTAMLSGGGPNPEKLQIGTTANGYELTVPVSRLKMTIPKGGLAPFATPNVGGATSSPRYFRFEDKAKQLTLSGWFESSGGFTGVRQLWSAEVAAWKKNHVPLPQNVSFIKLGGWDAVRYNMTVSEGRDCHLRAHWVQAGTWIDMHVSMYGKASLAELQAALEKFLGTIQVSEKPV